MIGIIGELLGVGGRIAESRIKLKETELRARGEAMLQGLDSEKAWEISAAENSKSSLADEWWTVLLSIPLILAFLGYDGVVERGFDALDNVPPWYTWAVLASVSFAFARKKMPSLGQWFRKK